MHADLASAAKVWVPTEDRGHQKNRFGAIPGSRIPAILTGLTRPLLTAMSMSRTARRFRPF